VALGRAGGVGLLVEEEEVVEAIAGDVGFVGRLRCGEIGDGIDVQPLLLIRCTTTTGISAIIIRKDWNFRRSRFDF
jgi:hypothetical protein